MSKIVLSCVLMLGALTMVVADADAQRMGRRGSIGRQSNNVTRQAPPANPSASPQAPRPGAAAPAALPPKPASPWKGIVGGLIGGALLASLFHSMGFGGMSGGLGSIMTFALMGLALFFLFRMFMRRRETAGAPSMFGAPPTNADSNSIFSSQPAAPAPASIFGSQPSSSPINSTSAFEPASVSTASNTSPSFANAGTWTLPTDFDVSSFLRHAKSNYIRLQAAWDRADINDIREFTSPEMFAELKLQLQERGAAKNETDVVTLDAELLGIETQAYDYLASVKFTGTVKEAGEVNAQPFSEVWNLAKPINGQSGWLLAGIQQLN